MMCAGCGKECGESMCRECHALALVVPDQWPADKRVECGEHGEPHQRSTDAVPDVTASYGGKVLWRES